MIACTSCNFPLNLIGFTSNGAELHFGNISQFQFFSSAEIRHLVDISVSNFKILYSDPLSKPQLSILGSNIEISKTLGELLKS